MSLLSSRIEHFTDEKRSTDFEEIRVTRLLLTYEHRIAKIDGALIQMRELSDRCGDQAIHNDVYGTVHQMLRRLQYELARIEEPWIWQQLVPLNKILRDLELVITTEY